MFFEPGHVDKKLWRRLESHKELAKDLQKIWLEIKLIVKTWNVLVPVLVDAVRLSRRARLERRDVIRPTRRMWFDHLFALQSHVFLKEAHPCSCP